MLYNLPSTPSTKGCKGCKGSFYNFREFGVCVKIHVYINVTKSAFATFATFYIFHCPRCRFGKNSNKFGVLLTYS